MLIDAEGRCVREARHPRSTPSIVMLLHLAGFTAAVPARGPANSYEWISSLAPASVLALSAACLDAGQKTRRPTRCAPRTSDPVCVPLGLLKGFLVG